MYTARTCTRNLVYEYSRDTNYPVRRRFATPPPAVTSADDVQPRAPACCSVQRRHRLRCRPSRVEILKFSRVLYCFYSPFDVELTQVSIFSDISGKKALLCCDADIACVIMTIMEISLTTRIINKY